MSQTYYIPLTTIPVWPYPHPHPNPNPSPSADPAADQHHHHHHTGSSMERQDVELADMAWAEPGMDMERKPSLRTKIIVGVSVALLVALFLVGLNVAVLYMAFGGSSSSSGDMPYMVYQHDEYTQMYASEKREKFRTPVMTVHAGKHNEVLFANAPRPAGNLLIHMVRARVINARTHREVLNTQVYNHHILIAQYHNRDPHTLMGIGAIGAEALRFDRPLQKPYVMISPEDYEFAIGCHLVNTWGMASLASIDVYVEYELYFRVVDDITPYKPFEVEQGIYGQGISNSSPSPSEVSEEEEADDFDKYPVDDVEFDYPEDEVDARAEREVAGDGENPFDTSKSWNVVYTRSSVNDDNIGEVGVDVPGTGEVGSFFEIETLFEWRGEDTVLVWGAGHIHIGSVDITMYDESDEVIMSSRALYNDSGYIVDITHAELEVQLRKGMRLRTVARYDNSVDYSNVMALMLLSTTSNTRSLEELHHAIDTAPPAVFD